MQKNPCGFLKNANNSTSGLKMQANFHAGLNNAQIYPAGPIYYLKNKNIAPPYSKILGTPGVNLQEGARGKAHPWNGFAPPWLAEAPWKSDCPSLKIFAPPPEKFVFFS